MERSGKIVPAFDENEFLRKVWITLAREDAPIEIFDQGVIQMSIEEKRILFDSISYDARWEGEIGHDRQESYIDYETYYEKIPYTDYERKYNSTKKQYEQVPIMKYRQEARQRAVTKTKTVTDWHHSNGFHSGTHHDSVCIDGEISTSQFQRDYDPQYVRYLTDAEMQKESDMVITESMYNKIQTKHDLAIESSVMHSLPGDHYRGISYSLDNYYHENTELIKIPQYEASINYKGSSYNKSAFPFGSMTLIGGKIPNSNGLAHKKTELDNKRIAAVNNQKKETENKIMKAVLPIALISIGLLLLSICISLFVKVLALVIAGFATSVAVFFLSHIYANMKIKTEKKKAENFAELKHQEMEREYTTFEKEYKPKVLAALNKKLASLGYEPAEHNEYSK